VVTKGQRLEVVLTARPTTGHLRIVVVPGGSIELDHRFVGGDSWEGDVAQGPHHIEVALQDVHATRDVLVVPGATAEEKIPLDVPAVVVPPEYRGFYGRLAYVTVFPLTNQQHLNSVTNVVDVNPGGTFENGGMFGLGGTAHVGYDFGVVSAEMAAALLLIGGANDNFQVKGQPGMTSMMCMAGAIRSQSLNAFVGPGVRVTTQGPTVRLTASIAAGLTIRNFSASRDCGDPGFNESASSVDPGLLFDTGMMIGGTPGGKFFVGVLGWADFPAQDTSVGPDPWTSLPPAFFTAPGRSYLLASGPQVYVGPALGVQFGH
jgi:hypothetical protein